MKKIIIIRGPAGIGKTTISKELSKKINGHYLSIDKVLEDNKLDEIVGDGIPEENFLKVNKIILTDIIPNIKEKYLIIDGNFYRLNQLNNLIEKTSSFTPKVIYLIGNLDTCISRNKNRGADMPPWAIKEVFDLVSKVNIGIKINTEDKNIEEIVNKISKHL